MPAVHTRPVLLEFVFFCCVERLQDGRCDRQGDSWATDLFGELADRAFCSVAVRAVRLKGRCMVQILWNIIILAVAGATLTQARWWLV